MTNSYKNASTSVRALLEGIVDYAGLFPPAKLDMEPAVQNYMEYLASDYAWMLGKFVCSRVRIEEALTAFKAKSNSNIVEFSMIGVYREERTDFLEQLKADAIFAQSIEDRTDGMYRIPSYEIKLPDSVTKKLPSWAIYELISEASQTILEKAPNLTSIYFETDLKSDWKNAIANVLDGIFRYRQVNSVADNELQCGFKLRCGGARPEDHPAIDLVETAVRYTKNASIPMKFTAGLHHPIRHYDETMKVKKHGFLNVFLASILHNIYNLNEENLKNLIAEEVSDNFHFSDHGLRWMSYQALTHQVQNARKDVVISFGSCSFLEPTEDLVALGLLSDAVV